MQLNGNGKHVSMLCETQKREQCRSCLIIVCRPQNMQGGGKIDRLGAKEKEIGNWASEHSNATNLYTRIFV